MIEGGAQGRSSTCTCPGLPMSGMSCCLPQYFSSSTLVGEWLGLKIEPPGLDNQHSPQTQGVLSILPGEVRFLTQNILDPTD